MSSIKITAIIDVKEECCEALKSEFEALVAASRQEAGNIRYDLHQAIDQPNRFVFFEHWQSQAAIDTHNNSTHFQHFLKAIDQCTDRVEIILMHDVSNNSN